MLLGTILELVILHYSQNKGTSLQAPFLAISILYFNPATCVMITVMAYVLQNMAYKFTDVESPFNINIKIIFNMSSRLLSIILTYFVVSIVPENYMLVKVMLAVLIYVIINFSTVFIIIYLATNEKVKLLNDIEEISYYSYASVLIGIILVYGHKAYGIIAITTVFMFLLPMQSTVLSRSAEKSVINSIYIDALTKLYNRASLNKILVDYINEQKEFTIIFLDFNRFKRINDNYGHDTGDQILIHFANSVRKILRKNDKVYRFGGDEFALIVPKEFETEAVISKLNSIKDTLVLEYSGFTIPYSFSIGTYEYEGEEGQTLEGIINQASHKMEEDKAKMHATDGLEGTYVDSRLI